MEMRRNKVFQMIEMSWDRITAKTIFIAIYSDYIALESPTNSKYYKKWVCDKSYILMYRLFFFLEWHEQI